MSDRILTDRQIRYAFSLAPVDLSTCNHLNQTPDYAAARFDRWLAAHDVEVTGRAQAAVAALVPDVIEGSDAFVIAGDPSFTIAPCVRHDRIRAVLDQEAITAYEAKIRAEAWDEGEVAGLNNASVPEDGEFTDNPYERSIS